MAVDNFNLIYDFLSFKESTDFYHLQIMVRKKDNPDAPSNNKMIKAYYIESKEHLLGIKKEIVLLCKSFNARAYINLGRKNKRKCIMNTIAGLATRFAKGNIDKIHREWNSQAGSLTPEETTWIVDVDDVRVEDIHTIKNVINSLQPTDNPNKIVLEVPTKSGVHLITRAFNLQQFSEIFPDVDVHKNNPTLLYYENRQNIQ